MWVICVHGYVIVSAIQSVSEVTRFASSPLIRYNLLNLRQPALKRQNTLAAKSNITIAMQEYVISVKLEVKQFQIR